MEDVTLKSVLHKIVEHLDLNPADRLQLHENVDLHDDPQAQLEKQQGTQAERDEKRAALQAQIDELSPQAPHGMPFNAPEPGTEQPFEGA